MKSNYKAIGELVERVDERNRDASITTLIGVSIDKKFIPSVANVIGTDLTNYKVIRKFDFAVSLMQVSRDEKIPVACQKEYEAAIMSPAYPIFRVKDTEIILPEYMEMWFMRSEFDREASFVAVGGVRGSMPWEEFAKLKLPVPTIEEQRKIVDRYNAITDRIALKKQINDNLLAATQAIYKSWFVDFEPFDGSKPSNWKNGRLKDVLSLQRSSIKAGENTSLPYLPIDIIPMNTFGLSDVKPNEEAQSSLITFSKDDIVIGAMRVYFHRVIIAPFDGITRTTCFTLRPFNADYLGFSLLCCDQDSSIEYAQQTSKGSTMPYAVWDGGLGDMEIPIPDPKTAHRFNEIVMPMIRIIQSSFAENKNLRELRDSLLPRLMSGELDVSDLDL